MGQRNSGNRDEAENPFDLSVAVPRKRVGLVRAVMATKRFAFIAAEDYREDVFFHFERFEPARPGQIPQKEMPVEFEVDEVYRRETGKLRALAVRPTNRPVSKMLTGRDAPQFEAQHHPRSRRRKPVWRNTSKSNESDLGTDDFNSGQSADSNPIDS